MVINHIRKHFYILYSIVIDVYTTIFLFILSLFGATMLLQNNEPAFGQTSHGEPTNHSLDTLVTNSLNLTEPVYQAYSGTFIGSKNLSSGLSTISEDYAIEKAIMKNVGNVTNNMTFMNTHLSDGTIQSTAKGTITSQNGQNINWISSDIGIINDHGELFHGIVQFEITDSPTFSFLSNMTGIDKQTPEIKRTIWLIEK